MTLVRCGHCGGRLGVADEASLTLEGRTLLVTSHGPSEAVTALYGARLPLNLVGPNLVMERVDGSVVISFGDDGWCIRCARCHRDYMWSTIVRGVQAGRGRATGKVTKEG
jgi:hypothetical protein